MIEKMKKIVIVAPQNRKTEMLNGIRELGVVHVSETAAPDTVLSDRLNRLNKVRSVLAEYPKVEQSAVVTGKAFENLNSKLEKAISDKSSVSDEITRLRLSRENIAAWGDFNPQEVLELKSIGLDFSFYLMTAKEVAAIPEEVRYVVLKSIEKKVAIAVVGTLDAEFAGNRFNLPQKGLGQIDAEIEAGTARLAEIEKLFAERAAYISSYDHEIQSVTDEIVFNSVSEAAGSEEGLCLISGFIPEADLDAFRAKAKSECWAFACDDPDEEDPVPTKVRYNKVTKMMKPMFDMLGTVPGYYEYDISMWFMVFLALFFAMIIGDAAYGMIFLALGVGMNIKNKSVNNLNLLVYVMSSATVVWGALTGTWFGSEAIMNVPFFRALVIPQIANYPQYFGVDPTSAQNAVMKFCFMVGTIQLSLACVMNIIRKWKQKNLALVSDIAWLVIIVAIYFMALMLVVGAQVNVAMIFAAIIIGFVFLIFFGGQAPGQSFVQGLKAGAAGAFTTFLNTISAFGNVMSYIRLFAVGMASLAIAQSFNGMASSMLKGWAFPAGVLILVIGHGLNIIMGMLSIIVHGVRLNLMEFSGQLGMEWAGIPYEPFKKNVK